MIPPPPISTPFPYTTLFRSPSASTSSAPPPPRSTMVFAFWPALSVKGWNAPMLDSILGTIGATPLVARSEEHTSELQSHVNLVCRLLLEKKKKRKFEGTKTD